MLVKKIAILLVIFMLVFTFAACGAKTDAQQTTGADNTGEQTTPQDETSGVSTVPEHNYKMEVIDEPTCIDSGMARYTCEDCGESFTEAIPALDHNAPAGSCEENAVCITCGEVIVPATGHQEQNGVCVVCGSDVSGGIDVDIEASEKGETQPE